MKQSNPELQLAGEYVRDTGSHIFLTGKAGTGKTTFLHSLRTQNPKRMVVTAPTGVAAINAGGVTLHSFFQLPFAPYIPGSDTNRSRYRFSKEKIDIIRNLDLLVIDEISMVRADVLDGVDDVLRRFRSSDRPFGGVQLLMIGDLFQLPPVVREDDWQHLQSFYASPYFFSSTALQKTELVTIELRHIYRQVDSRFIELLNRVRNASLDSSSLQALNARHIDGFVPKEEEGYITLCTHNRSADAINDFRLEALKPQAHAFEAEIEGDFPEHAYPAAASLKLKRGAQVMFVRNDLSPEKRFFNGKIGTITRFAGKDVHIRCPGEGADIVVEPVTWENIEYALNRETLEITESKIGTFRQYPLRLAWAITIHKSQGLTFDKAVIDTQAAFAHGQVYVALSRCRTLDGMVLSTPLATTAIRTDPAVLRFSEGARRSQPTADQLQSAKIQYQQELLLECFDFRKLRRRLRRIVSLLLGNPGVVHLSGGEDIRALELQVEAEICNVGEKFVRQLQGLFPNDTLPAADAAILDRIAKASAYFGDKIASGLGRIVPGLRIDTDNKALLKKVNRSRKLLQAEIDLKLAAVGSCANGFSTPRYFRALSGAAIDTGKKKESPPAPTFSEDDIAYRDLFDILKAWRSEKAASEGVPHFHVMHQKPLVQIAVNLPDTLPALKQIKGIGTKLAERYGEELVAMVSEYRGQHRIETVDLPEPTPVDAKPRENKAPHKDTKKLSLELFEKGLSLSQIANERGLVLATIEGHLAHFVESGKISIDRLVTEDKQKIIEKELSRSQASPMREIKQALGSSISYGEIKLVQADLKRRAGDPGD